MVKAIVSVVNWKNNLSFSNKRLSQISLLFFAIHGEIRYNQRQFTINKQRITMTKKKVKVGSNTIALNKRARHEYFIEDEIEAGLELQGWEVKSMRAGKANISDSYIIFKNGEAYLFGATIQPLSLASTHVVCDPTRTRKLLLNKRELDNLFGKSSRDGFTIVALSLYWKGPWAKIKIGLAKGKKQHDNRDDIKEREWKVAKERIMKNAHRG